jgi:hypothetical protein
MNEIPTDAEMADVFNSLMCLSERYGMLYGSPRATINKVLRFWGSLGLRELEKIEAAKYEPKFKAPTFPIYDENCNIIG